jgi:hypothetical protein
MYVSLIKIDKHDQRCEMRFFFLHGKRDKAIYGEFGGALGEATVSLATVKSWCQRFKLGNFLLMTRTHRDYH